MVSPRIVVHDGYRRLACCQPYRCLSGFRRYPDSLAFREPPPQGTTGASTAQNGCIRRNSRINAPSDAAATTDASRHSQPLDPLLVLAARHGAEARSFGNRPPLPAAVTAATCRSPRSCARGPGRAETSTLGGLLVCLDNGGREAASPFDLHAL